MTVPQSITPKKLRLVLSATIVLIILAGAGIFYLAYTQLSKTAVETGEQVASANQSQDTLQQLQALEKELQSMRDVITMTSHVTADSKNYAYQDRLVHDLTTYASRANLTIRNISFTNQAAAGSTSAPVTGEETGSPEGMPPATSSPSMRSATVDITLESPVNYQDLLNFLHYIEQNLTKMKVSRVVMSQGEGDSVTIDVLNLEVYLR